jgi:hypothetical protein
MSRFSVAFCALLFAGCGGGTPEHRLPGRGRANINERAGTLQTVGIGDRQRAVMARFGRPRPFSEREQFEPVGEDPNESGGPRASGFPSRCSRRRPRPAGSSNPRAIGVEALRYPGVSFITCLRRVFEFTTSAKRAATLRDIALGDPLSRAHRAYPGFRCGPPDRASDYPSYPYCAGKVGPGRYVWFGKDPIASITVSTEPLNP